LNNIIIQSGFLTNFKPTNFSYLNDFNFYKVRKSSKILLRNFFLFIFLLKYLINKNNIKTNQSIWIKPIHKKIITILKAPYKNKTARNQLLFKRFFFVFKLKFFLKEKLVFNDLQKLLKFIQFFKKFNLFIESSLMYQYKIKIIFNFYFKNFFLVNN
jgi:hypothetical protein